MAKRLMVLLGMLALALATAVPVAFAQEAPEYQYGAEGPRIVTATGMLGEPYTPGQDPTPVYDLTDEATGTTYRLFDVGAGLEPFVGQRVTVEGTRSPGIDPLSLDVTSVVPVGPGGPPPGPMPGSSATFTYELAVECEPPADATFLGFTALESLVTTPLADPDGDGVYTGSQTVPRFAPGPTPPGTEPIALSPVRIVQGPPTAAGPLGPEYRVIKDFGAVTAEDTTLSASVSFCNGNGGSDDVVSGDTSNADKDGSGSDGMGGGSVDAGGSGSVVASDGAGQDSASPIASVLPATGGVLPIAGLAGLLIIAAGLLVRKISR